MAHHAPTRRRASSTTPPLPLRLVLRGPARSLRLLARGVTVQPPLGPPLRRPRVGARTLRWPIGRRARERDPAVHRTMYPPSRASEVLRVTAPHNRSRKTRDQMTGAQASRHDHQCPSTSTPNESLMWSLTYYFFSSASLCRTLPRSWRWSGMNHGRAPPTSFGAPALAHRGTMSSLTSSHGGLRWTHQKL